MVALLERLSAKAHKDAGWPGILVGDMSQPRGGPMLTGHASHQVGLDADIWLTPMPNRQLSRNEREEMSAVMMVRSDRLDIDPKVWTPTPSRGDPRRGAGADACSASSSMPRSRRRCAARPRATAAGCPRCGRCTATTITSISASNARRAASECEIQPAPTDERRLQRRRPRLLVQGFGAASEAAERAAEAEAADDAGAIAGRLQAGAGRAGCQAITPQ